MALHVLTNDRFQFPLYESLRKVEVMRLDEALHDGVLVGIFDFPLERLFHLRPQALLKFGQRGVGAAIFGKLVVQVWKRLDLDGVNVHCEGDSLARHPRIRMACRIGLRNFYRIALRLSENMPVYFQP